MITVRVSLLSLVLAGSFASVACNLPSASDPTEDQGKITARSRSTDTALKVDAESGACASVKALATKHSAELEDLCKGETIPLPTKIEKGDCGDDTATSVTFTCSQVDAPPLPAGSCSQVVIEDETHGIAASGNEYASSLPDLVCPAMGGAPREPGPGKPAAHPGQEDQEDSASSDARPSTPTGGPSLPPGAPNEPTGGSSEPASDPNAPSAGSGSGSSSSHQPSGGSVGGGTVSSGSGSGGGSVHVKPGQPVVIECCDAPADAPKTEERAPSKKK